MERPRRELLENVAFRQNVTLNLVRQTKMSRWCHALVSDKPIPAVLLEIKDGSSAFPLYIYKRGVLKRVSSLFERGDEQPAKHLENFSVSFRKFIDTKYQRRYSPEEILGYIYAVLHSSTYREFLRIDFPRIPFPHESKQFDYLSKLGWELVQAHLLSKIPDEPVVDLTKGSDLIESSVYVASSERLYINSQQYFAQVSSIVWDFTIGGYQVLHQYLKSRRGREISLDEKENVRDTIKALHFTIGQMRAIDDQIVDVLDSK
jgi:hypothetical protein